MANTLPLNIEMAALPPNVASTPQQLADMIAARLFITTQQSFALFVSGSTEPGSNVGPWLKDGTTWYVWDSVSGDYVPQTIEPSSLGYFIGNSAPDPTVYSFWIETAVSGEPLALKIYYSGSWTDVYADTLSNYLTIAAAALAYQPLNANLTTLTTSTLGDIIYSSATNTLSKLAGHTAATKRFLTQTGTGTVSAAPAWAAIAAGDIPDISATYLTVATAAATYQTIAGMANYSTTTQMNTAINNAVAAIVVGQGVFRATPSANQDIAITPGLASTDVDFGTEDFDPDSDFGSNVFTAPANGYYHFEACLQLSVQTVGSATDVDYSGNIVSSGGTTCPMSGRDDTALGQSYSTGSCTLYLTAAQTVKVTVAHNTDANCTIRVNTGGSYFSGFRVR
jgi:hypothetical protein